MTLTSIQPLESRRLLSLTPIGGETIVPQSLGASAWDVAAANNGMYIVATETRHDAPTSNDPTTAEIGIVRYSASGEQLGEPLTINLQFPNNSAPQMRVSASMDSDGDAVVAYAQSAGDNEFGAVKVVRISKQGVMGTPFDVVPPVPTVGSGYALPAISMDDGGGFFLAWQEHSDDDGFGGGVIRARAFDASDAPRNDALDIVTIGFSESYDNIEIAAYADGSGAIVATGTLGGEGPTVVSFTRVSTSAVVGESISPASGSSTSAPSIDVYPDKSFVAAYMRQHGPLGEPPAVYASYVQRYSAAGVAQGNEIEVGQPLPGTGTDKHTYGIDVAATPDGGFVASFGQLVEQTDTVYAERYDAAGVADGAPIVLDSSVRGLISFPPTDQGGPTHIATDDNGVAIATWRNLSEDLVKFQRLASQLDILLDRGALTIFGTSSDDTISVQLQGDNIVATRVAVTKTFDADDVNFISINGFAGNDSITNDTALPSTLSGGEGDDTVYGGDGADKIRGESGRDSLWGRDGNDTIFGDDGVDSLYGNGGRDRIDGGANSDHIRGNSGRDKLFGGHGNDRIYGSESADWLYGQRGADRLYGEGGNDRLYADDNDSARDTLSGGAGDDILVSRDTFIDDLFGDRGNDTAIADEDDLLTGIENSS